MIWHRRDDTRTAGLEAGYQDELRIPSDLLLGYAHGTLSAGERRTVECELCARPELRSCLDAVVGRRAARRTLGPRMLRPALAAFALAATLLFAFGAPALLFPDANARAGAALRRGDMHAAVALLGGGEPFWPVVVRRASGQRYAVRGLTSPRGMCFERAPQVRFHFTDGVGPYRVAVYDELGRELGSTTTDATACEWSPALAPLEPDSVYTLQVSDEGRRGPPVIGSITTASAEKVDELRRALGELDSVADADARALLCARERARRGDIEGSARELASLLERTGGDVRRALDALTLDPALDEALNARLSENR